MSWKSWATAGRVEGVGASGADESAGVDLEMQHGQCWAQDSVQTDLLEG